MSVVYSTFARPYNLTATETNKKSMFNIFMLHISLLNLKTGPPYFPPFVSNDNLADEHIYSVIMWN